MNIRIVTVAPLLFLLLAAQVAAGQAPAAANAGAGRYSLRAGAGTLLNGGGQTWSAAFGVSPVSRVDLVVNVERDHLPFRRDASGGGVSTTRGGTMTFVSGEVRVSLFPPDRVSPYGVAGIGAGVSRPTVNDAFPDPVENGLRVVYAGGGVQVPVREGLSVFGDVRVMLAVEGEEGVLGVWPVRAGVAWRF